MKSLAKENKKLQRLLNISLRSSCLDDKAQEGNGPNLVPVSETSYNNMSVRTEFKMNASMNECPSQDKSKASGVEDGQKSASQPGLKKKIRKHRSQFFARKQVDLEESEPSENESDTSSAPLGEADITAPPVEEKELEFQN